MTKIFYLLVAVLIAACGGGGDIPTTALIPIAPVVVAFYGDSITAGRPMDIAQGAFEVQDFAVPAKDSNAPLDAQDRSSITVLRYGMADTIHNIPPETTRDNLARLVAQIEALGRKPVVVNINQTESGLERPTNAAIAPLVTIDVSGVQGATVDGVHPTEAFHVALNQKIHNGLMAYIHR